MIIQCDTRQKKKHHTEKERYFESHGYDIKHFGMVVGDYQILGKGDIVVDTKQNMVEMYGNLVQDHDRFHRECVLAMEAGVKLYVLIENINGITKLSEIVKWNNPQYFKYIKQCRELTGVKKGKDKNAKSNFYQVFIVAKTKGIKLPKPPVNNQALITTMRTMQDKYGVEFVFCTPQESGKKVLELIGAI